MSEQNIKTKLTMGGLAAPLLLAGAINTAEAHNTGHSHAHEGLPVYHNHSHHVYLQDGGDIIDSHVHHVNDPDCDIVETYNKTTGAHYSQLICDDGYKSSLYSVGETYRRDNSGPDVYLRFNFGTHHGHHHRGHGHGHGHGSYWNNHHRHDHYRFRDNHHNHGGDYWRHNNRRDGGHHWKGDRHRGHDGHHKGERGHGKRGHHSFNETFNEAQTNGYADADTKILVDGNEVADINHVPQFDEQSVG